MSKRIFDIVCAFLLLALTMPLFPLIIALILVTSRRPAFYCQKRIGKRGKIFFIYKFRTLTQKAMNSADRIERRTDHRITIAGRLLRPLHLDELPQLLNVLCGEMSMVGPRPLLVEQYLERVRQFPAYALRSNVLPGITGLVQIGGRKKAIVRGTRYTLSLDLLYIKRRGFRLDSWIMLQTIFVVLSCSGV